MLQSYSLFTTEIDDVEAALADIGTQVDALPLCKHSVGIAVCHYDYISNGIIQALVKRLPFPIMGVTSFYQATSRSSGLFALTVTVLTSDTVRFAVASSESVDNEQTPADIVRDTYRLAHEVHGEAPSMLLSFLSIEKPITGDEYLRLIDACSGGVPHFGGLSIGDDETEKNVYIFTPEAISHRGFVMLLLIGDFKARFAFGNYKEEKLLEMTATVTRARGENVYELNGQPSVEYLRKCGFMLDDSERNLVSNIPLLYKQPGESLLIARTLAGFDAEGALHCFGEIPEQSLLRVGSISIEDILDVSEDAIRCAVEEQAAAVLVFSCIGRYIILGLDPTSEMERVKQAIPADASLLACYVGGEICPIVSSGGMKNCYHNASIVVCTLA